MLGGLADSFVCCSCGRQEEELIKRKRELEARRGTGKRAHSTPPGTPSGHSTPSTAPSLATERVLFASPSSQRDSQPCGVGISFSVDGSGMMRVESLVHGGPAYTSGMVRRDDVLVEVDGCDVTGMPVETVGGLITGPQNTYVTMGFERTVRSEGGQPATSQVVTVEMVRVHIRDITRSLSQGELLQHLSYQHSHGSVTPRADPQCACAPQGSS
mmetsp:Transcript_17896/g.43843  ORF Transcript_17896/g.43843 Transcript_17896/m.43843 type:complete len:214 (+) Transcript_17896:152-793(+)